MSMKERLELCRDLLRRMEIEAQTIRKVQYESHAELRFRYEASIAWASFNAISKAINDELALLSVLADAQGGDA